jgi:hypothetical protein
LRKTVVNFLSFGNRRRISIPYQMTLTRDELGPRRASQPTNTSSAHHHESVTSSPDALQFDAAASLQICRGDGSGLSAPLDSRLIVAPYSDDTHLLDLTTLDIPNQLLAKALTVLKPIRPDYATAEYSSSFNWTVVLEMLRQLVAEAGYQWGKQSFYVVTFRSRLSPSADSSRLHDLDYYSLAEATSSGGLLKYWFGAKDEKLQNLATCM